MTASLAPVAPKLAKLIPLLSSNQPGEVVATAAAIGRTLRTAGLSWHDLAERVATAPAPFVWPPPPKPAAQQPAPPPPEPKWKAPWPTYTRLKQSQRIAWLEAAEKRSAWIMERRPWPPSSH